MNFAHINILIPELDELSMVIEQNIDGVVLGS